MTPNHFTEGLEFYKHFVQHGTKGLLTLSMITKPENIQARLGDKYFGEESLS
jgi:hypothetical protein